MPTKSTKNVVYDDGDICTEGVGEDSEKVVVGFQSMVVVGNIKDSEDGATVSFKGDTEVTVVGHAITTIRPLDPEDHYLRHRSQVQMGDVFQRKEDGRLYVHTGKRTAPPSELKPDQQTW
jgi:hypothetical protein